jgi:hypothetical protein
MSPAAHQPDRPEHILLAQAIADIQGSIHANDSKSAAGLVVQGLLATAVVTVVSRLGAVYQHGTPAAQEIIKLSLAGSLLTAVVSVFFLLDAVRPYTPGRLAKRLRKRYGYKEVFFPNIREFKRDARRSSDEEFNQLVSGVEADAKALGEPDAMDREYVAELLKVAGIRAHEASRAQAGFLLLGLEVLFVAAYLATVGCIAGHWFGAAAVSSKPSLAWDLVQGGQRLRIASGSSLTLSSSADAQVSLRAGDDAGLRRIQLVSRTALRCVRRGVRRNILASEPTTQDVRLSHLKSFMLAAKVDTRARRCPRRLRYAGVVVRFSAVAQSDTKTLTSGWLVLHVNRPNFVGGQ